LKTKRKAIEMTRLAEDRSPELRTMVASLCIGHKGAQATWSRRFAASGKAVGKLHRNF
jgi:hypothetical protein